MISLENTSETEVVWIEESLRATMETLRDEARVAAFLRDESRGDERAHHADAVQLNTERANALHRVLTLLGATALPDPLGVI